jgi:hypothetical protein
MGRYINVKPLNETIDAIKANIQFRRDLLDRELADKIRDTELVRQAMAMLDGAGIPMHVSQYDDPHRLRINLGERLTKADNNRITQQLVTIRQLLGKMKLYGKDLENAKRRLIGVELKCEDWPVTVTYLQRLPRNAKCKIVSRRQPRYSTLVCNT